MMCIDLLSVLNAGKPSGDTKPLIIGSDGTLKPMDTSGIPLPNDADIPLPPNLVPERDIPLPSPLASENIPLPKDSDIPLPRDDLIPLPADKVIGMDIKSLDWYTSKIKILYCTLKICINNFVDTENIVRQSDVDGMIL